MERRQFILNSDFRRWCIREFSDSLAHRSRYARHGRRVAGRQVGQTDVEAIREVTQTFLRLDNLFGGGRARPTVVRYLHDEVTPLLRSGNYSDAVGRELFAAAAELTRLAGWMAYDLEQHGLAQRYLIQALRLAGRGRRSRTRR